jgi:lysylphosphatidylglycerol synthetase-like protein (DUF2156 family)
MSRLRWILSGSPRMTSISVENRDRLLRRFGSFTQAYSATFQPGLVHFGDGDGFIAYRMVGRTAFALADPLVEPARSRDLITKFVTQFGDVCFMQTARPTAEILASLGFTINEMGTEARLDLATHDFAGRKYRAFRLATNRAEAKGYSTKECGTAEVGETTIKRVSERWRRTKTIKSREIRFINRPIVFADEPDVRKFYTFDEHRQLIGFSFFDPIYEDGLVVGYLMAFRRYIPEADPLINYAMAAHAIKVFRGEGRRWLYLGLSPIAEIEDKDFTYNWLVRRSFRFIYENRLFNKFIFPMKGLAAHKRSYGPASEQTYFAFNTLPTLPRLIKALWLTRLI